MRAVQWFGPGDVRVVDSLPRPAVRQARDAVIRVSLAAICGTDLHPFRGEIPDFPPGTIMGHEFTGVVEETGSAVRAFRPGDRVVASDVIACGECWFCRRGWHYQCAHVGLFGYGMVVGSTAVAGGQAEYVRVPYADVVLARIPDGLRDEQALFVGDILTTGYTAAAEGGTAPGDTVAVVGCGPVGLCALLSAQVLGAARVLAIDPDARRRAFAAAQGGHPLSPGDDLPARVRALTDGRGADVVLEAVGSDAALRTALDIVRPRGTVCAVGAHASAAMPFPSGMAFNRELTVRFAVGDPIRTRGDVLALLCAGRLDPAAIISHRLPLDRAPDGYRLFDRGEAIKVVISPGSRAT